MSGQSTSADSRDAAGESCRRVEMMLASAGLAADESELRGLAAAHRAHRDAVAALYAVPMHRSVGPMTHPDNGIRHGGGQ